MERTPQGFGPSREERLPLPDRSAMTDAQRTAADAIISGPRKAIFGPFVPLLRTPALMDRIGKTGEALRFEGTLPDRVRELAICVVARRTSNQFEWQIHAALAAKAGVSDAALEAIAAGRVPRDVDDTDACAVDFVSELMQHNGVSDATYGDAVARLGESGAVELAALVGYFTMVCWIMNVARTPGPVNATAAALAAFPG